jgi:pyruvate dehydrogenase E2 component (dihydrolipoamide acetyltransferase)
MADARIKPIVMAKWGLTMTEGKVTSWRKNPVTQSLAKGIL